MKEDLRERVTRAIWSAQRVRRDYNGLPSMTPHVIWSEAQQMADAAIDAYHKWLVDRRRELKAEREQLVRDMEEWG